MSLSCLFIALFTLCGSALLTDAFVMATPSGTKQNPLFSAKATEESSTTTTTTTASSTDAVTTVTKVHPYSADELEKALYSLLADSTDPDFDARHFFGYKDPAHKLSKLQEITATVLLDTQKYQEEQGETLEELAQQAAAFAQKHGPVRNLQSVIQEQAPRMALAAEFKRASPSKGRMAAEDVSAAQQGSLYTKAGANILSVLTEPRWFQGSLQDLTDIRLQTQKQQLQQDEQRPAILRKDFVINEYMIAQAAAAGADTILLIVAVLPQHVLHRLIQYSRETFQMEPLVEVHTIEELDVALQAGAKVIGVNNRNLHTFQMDLNTSERVARELESRGLTFAHPSSDANDEMPPLTLCALSGMSNAMDVDRYRKVGLGMCLIGESLMRAPDPVAAIESLCLDPADWEKQQKDAESAASGAYTAGTQLVKVCGITNPEDALVACRSGANLIGVIFAAKSPRKVSPEQATDIVAAVRQFGERTSRLTLPAPMPKVAPLLHLTQRAHAVAQTATAQRPAVVGVFQNQDLAYIRDMVETCGLDFVQLHGSEGMAAASKCGVPTIRVVDIPVDAATGETSSTAVDEIRQAVTTDPVAILLDTAIKGSQAGGGTGVAFDWKVADALQNAGLPVLVAGGLTADSVADCITQVRPFGVDVSSGVEGPKKGQKDHEAVKQFVTRARAAAKEANQGF